MIKLDRCDGSCDTINDLSYKVCVPKKAEDLNLTVFNMITGTNKSKNWQSIYHAIVNVNLIVENVIQIKSGIMINVDVSVKNIIYVKKIIFGILLHVVPKMKNT